MHASVPKNEIRYGEKFSKTWGTLEFSFHQCIHTAVFCDVIQGCSPLNQVDELVLTYSASSKFGMSSLLRIQFCWQTCCQICLPPSMHHHPTRELVANLQQKLGPLLAEIRWQKNDIMYAHPNPIISNFGVLQRESVSCVSQIRLISFVSSSMS